MTRIILNALILFVLGAGMAAAEWTSYIGIPKFNAIVAHGPSMYLGTNNGLVIINQSTDSQQLIQFSVTGLPSNVINDICVDDTGLIWLGTNNGLVSFDLANFTVYNTSNSGLFSNTITHIAADSTGTLWVSYPHGFSSWRTGSWTEYTAGKDSLSSDSILAFAADGNGTLYAGTDKGLLKFDSSRWTSFDTSSSAIPGNTVTALTVDRSGILWVGTLLSGLASLADTVWAVFDTANSTLPSDKVTSLMCDENGAVWVGLSNYLAKMEADTFSVRASSHGIVDLVCTGTGPLWYVTNNFDVDFFYSGPRVLFSSDKKSFAQKAVSLKNLPVGTFGAATQQFKEMALDSQKRLWAATNNGLLGFDGLSFTLTTGLTKRVDLLTVSVDSAGAIWAGASGMYGGMGYLSGTLKTQYNVSEYVRAIAVDPWGTKWVATGSNLEGSALHEIRDTIHLQYPMTLANPSAIETDRTGNIWVGFASGLLKFTVEHTWESVGFPGTQVNRLKADGAGNLWVATSAQGLLFYNSQTKGWTAYDTTNSAIPSNLVTDVVIQSNQIIWIATSKGLARFAYGDWEAYDSFNSAISPDYVQSLGLQADGKVWVATVQRLLMFNDSARSAGIEKDRPGTSGSLPDISISPNPFASQTLFIIAPAENQHRSLVIYSVAGKVIRSFTLNTGGLQKVYWDGKDAFGRNIAAGVYLVRVDAKGAGRSISKLLKMN